MAAQQTIVDDPVEIARSLAAEFRPAVVAAERNAEPPIEEIDLLRTTPLADLPISTALGGAGGTSRETAGVVAELAKVDPGIGAIAAAHYRAIGIVGTESVLERSAAERWIWGDLTGFATSLEAEPQGDGGLRVTGQVRAAVGVQTSDVVVFAARLSGAGDPVPAFVPVDREGVSIHEGPSALGLRRAASHTVAFDAVVVGADELLDPVRPLAKALGALAFGALYVGAGIGAVDSAADYVVTRQSPRPGQGPAIDEPFTQLFIGEIVAELAAAQALGDHVASGIDLALVDQADPHVADLAAIEAQAAGFRALAARAALRAGERIFEPLGVSATKRDVGFDRYWRDVRAHSLEGGSLAAVDLAVGRYAVNEPDQGAGNQRWLL